MTDVSCLIQRQVKKTYFSVSPRAAELSVIFMEDRCKVLTNVPTGSTPFLFRACRAIPGIKPEFVTCCRVLLNRQRDWDDRTTWQFCFEIVGFNLARGTRVSQAVREVAGNVRIDLRSVICRCTAWRHSWHSSISGMAYRLSSDPASH